MSKPTELERCIVLDGREYRRVRYGEEKCDWGADRQPCGDCSALKGELHAYGCDVERCPACEGQLITCQCCYDAEGMEP